MLSRKDTRKKAEKAGKSPGGKQKQALDLLRNRMGEATDESAIMRDPFPIGLLFHPQDTRLVFAFDQNNNRLLFDFQAFYRQ